MTTQGDGCLTNLSGMTLGDPVAAPTGAPKCDRGCGRSSVFRWSKGESYLDLCWHCSDKSLPALTEWATEVRHEEANA